MMSAFLIVDTDIKNPVEYEKYKALAKPVAEQYGGVYRARGGKISLIQDALWTPTRMVIIEFPDMQSAQAFIDSEEYAPIKPIRLDNSECTLFILEGD